MQWLVLGMATALATACGGTVSMTTDEAPPDPSAPGTTSPPGTGGMSPAPPPVPMGACGVPENTPYLVTTDNVDPALVFGDGSRRQLDAGYDQLPTGGTRRTHVAVAGDRLHVIARVTFGFGDSDSLLSTFDAQGELLHRIALPNYDVHRVAVGDDGSMVVSRRLGQSPPEYAFVNEGMVQSLPPSVTPNTTRYVGGVMSALVHDAQAFFDLASMTSAPVQSMAGATDWRVRPGMVVSLHSGSGLELQVETPGGTSSFPLPLISAPPFQLRIGALGDDHIVVHQEETQNSWRVSLDDGTALPLPHSTPEGGLPVEMLYCQPRPVVGSDGSVLIVGGDEELHFQTYLPETGEWATVGEPVREVEAVGVEEYDGTWVLRGQVQTFCPGLVGEGANGLPGASTQVVRPGATSVTLAPDVVVAVQSGGECIGFIEDNEVVVLDLGAGESTRHAGTSLTFWNEP